MPNNLTNEQKLEEIYTILTSMERRRMQAWILRLVKWIIIIWLVGFVVSNPWVVISKLTEIIQPIVMEQVQTMMEQNKDALMESVKDFMPK
jgi:hypothetical protein